MQLHKYAEHVDLLSQETGALPKKKLLDLIVTGRPVAAKHDMTVGGGQNATSNAQKLITFPRPVARLFLKTGRLRQLQDDHSIHGVHLDIHSKGLLVSAKQEAALSRVNETLLDWKRKVGAKDIWTIPSSHQRVVRTAECVHPSDQFEFELVAHRDSKTSVCRAITTRSHWTSFWC